MIRKIDPKTGEALGSIPAPDNGGDSGLACDKGALWVGQHRGRKIYQFDPETGQVLWTIESDRFVTWVDGELWHGTWQEEQSDVPRIDPDTGEVIERLERLAGTGVSGLNRTATTGSSAKVETAERSEPSADRDASMRPCDGVSLAL